MAMNSKSIFTGIQSSSFAVLAGAICLFVAAGVSAQESKPCAADAAKLCKGVVPGEGRVAKCMKEHEKELSPSCKASISGYKEEAREFADACKADAQKNCKDVKPGGGRVLQCLKKNEATLSPECKEAMSKPRGKR
jgi:hypothetical protein